ncbi:cytochrome P450 [Fodinicola acaciae]|uniref:cytochrome P450 n=1 Tax=Fodinicola acaciae TaxID=2681555 RepID=UPI0013D000E1|nr:cytochrome P450 [Fodinicola acaciae]
MTDVSTDEETLAPFDPSSTDVISNPYPTYQRYRERDPVHWGVSALAGYPGAWYVFRHADTLVVLKDERFAKARRSAPSPTGGQPVTRPIPDAAKPYFAMARTWIAHRDPPDHTRLRELLWPHFTVGAVQRLRPVVNRIADYLIDRLDTGAADLVADYAAVLPFHVVAGLLGVPEPDWPRLVDWSIPMRNVGTGTTEQTWRQASAAVTDFGQYLGELVERRRKEPADDLLTRLVEAREAGAFVDDDELVANALFLVFASAGLHTTTALVATTVRLLLTHPAEKAKLAADPALLPAAVHEVLRLEPPLQMTNRTAAADVELAGQRIAEGDSVLAILASANRDPAVYPEPDRFDIARRRQSHQTFSAGIHTCFGGPMASLEAEIAVDRLLRRLPGLALAGPAEWLATGSLRQLSTLPVTY